MCFIQIDRHAWYNTPSIKVENDSKYCKVHALHPPEGDEDDREVGRCPEQTKKAHFYSS